MMLIPGVPKRLTSGRVVERVSSATQRQGAKFLVQGHLEGFFTYKPPLPKSAFDSFHGKDRAYGVREVPGSRVYGYEVCSAVIRWMS